MADIDTVTLARPPIWIIPFLFVSSLQTVLSTVFLVESGLNGLGFW